VRPTTWTTRRVLGRLLAVIGLIVGVVAMHSLTAWPATVGAELRVAVSGHASALGDLTGHGSDAPVAGDTVPAAHVEPGSDPCPGGCAGHDAPHSGGLHVGLGMCLAVLGVSAFALALRAASAPCQGWAARRTRPPGHHGAPARVSRAASGRALLQVHCIQRT
jgi:hypothetical protein